MCGPGLGLELLLCLLYVTTSSLEEQEHRLCEGLLLVAKACVTASYPKAVSGSTQTLF